jgi:taurine dioxygenase
MRVAAITDVIGAEISGIDLSQPPTSAEVEELETLLADHGVLFFRDQHLAPEALQDFARRLGVIDVHPYERNLGGALEGVTVLDAHVLGGGKAPAVPWHTDATFLPAPPRASILQAVEIPAVGGDTLWASTYATYDALSSKMQRFVDDLDAVHDAMPTFGARAARGSLREDAVQEMTKTVHPVVVTHPVTRRRTLFANQVFTTSVEGLSRSESAALLRLLFDLVNDPGAQVRLRWQPGTVAMWDNRCTQHAAVSGYQGRRLMHRVTLQGMVPSRDLPPASTDRMQTPA